MIHRIAEKSRKSDLENNKDTREARWLESQLKY